MSTQTSGFMTVSDTNVDICIVGGAGHVGLPLAIVLADKGHKVSIYDINEKVLGIVASGQMPFKEEDAEPVLKRVLAKGSLLLSSNPAAVGRASTVVITIGTPVDEFLNPTLAAVQKCIDGLMPHIADNTLIVLRSTVFPGVTDWLHRYFEQKNKKVRLAFCPERIVQGLAIKELQEFPQIVSGTTPDAEEASAAVFRSIAPEVVRMKPIEAEFAKLFSNAYRYIQFAISNQFFMMTNEAGVDFYRVLEGLKKDYPRAKDLPKAGFAAGPCLFKDTMQLAAFSNNQFGLGHAAMLVNEGLVLYIADKLQKKYPIGDFTVGLLGMAFKADSDDIRSSLSYKLKKVLSFRAKKVLTTDPHVVVDPEISPLEQVIDQSDILILCTPHPEYKKLNLKGKPLVDIWGLSERSTDRLL